MKEMVRNTILRVVNTISAVLWVKLARVLGGWGVARSWKLSNLEINLENRQEEMRNIESKKLVGDSEGGNVLIQQSKDKEELVKNREIQIKE